MTRRHIVPLLLLALLVALMAVALRGCEIRGPKYDGIEPFRNIVTPPPPPTPPRVRAAENPATPPSRSVRVTVASLDGTPIAGARVELFRGPVSERWTDNEAGDYRPSVVAPQPVASATSDATGDALLDVPPGRWFVAASAPGVGRRAVVAPESGAGSVVLAPSVPFGGTITAADGSPAQGVAVVLAPTWTTSKWPSDAGCLRTATDRDGRYAFVAEPGEYRVWYGPQADLLLQADRVRIPALDRYDVALSAGAVIEGTIGDVDSGDPLAGAEVLAVHDAGVYGSDAPIAVAAGRTDARGRFALHTWTSRAAFDSVLVDDPRVAPEAVGDTGKHSGGEVFDGDHVALDVRVRRSASVVGVLSAPDGPIPGFRVGVGTDAMSDLRGLPAHNLQYREAVTDADGRFRIQRLAPGEATVSVLRPREYSDAVQQDTITLTAGTELVHDVALDVVRTRIEGRVVEPGDPDELPLADVEVAQEEGTLRSVARTDADGRFAMEVQLFGGAAALTLRRDGFLTWTQVVKPDEAGALSLSSHPYVAVGTVTDATGTHVPGARVELISGQVAQGAFILDWPGSAETVTADDGTFRVPVTSTECDAVIAVRPSDGAQSSWADVDHDPIDVRLAVRRRIAGRVVVAGGDAPVAGALVHEMSPDWSGEYDVVIGRTREDGRFDVDYEPGEKDALRFAGTGFIDRRVADKDVADELLVELTPSLVLAGEVRNADGSPAAGARVVATPVDPATHDDSSVATTDSSGRFLIRDMVAGRWNLLAHRDDLTIVPTRAVVTAGDRGIILVVRPGRAFAVAVVDADGAPVWEAEVSARVDADSQAVDFDKTNGTGRASLAVPPDAPLVVRVEKDGFEPFERGELRPSDEPLRIVLARKSPR